MDIDQGEKAATHAVNPGAVAFGNHLILENILRNLSTGNLRTLQLVNKLWNSVASTVLKKERRLKVRFNYKTSPDCIRSRAARGANLATIYELDFGDIVPWKYQDLENCKAHVEALNSLIAEDATGKLATGVTLKIVQRFLQPETTPRAYFSFFEMISCTIRNLVILTLDLTQYRYDILLIDRGHNFQNVQLPHLEQVTFLLKISCLESRDYKPICKLVMNAAPTLKVIKGTSLSCIWDTIVECGKGACIKSYTVGIQSIPLVDQTETLLLRFVSLIEHAPALELLKLDQTLITYYNNMQVDQTNVKKVWSAIRRLLINYRKSLRYIWAPQLAFAGLENDHVDVPVFENLEFLNLTKAGELLQSVRPASLIKNQFPCLTYVKLEVEDLTGDRLAQYFPRTSEESAHQFSLPAVRRLDLGDRYDKRGMEILCQLFPNVKEIKFYQIIGEYTHSWQNGLWNMPPSVECLTLHFVALNYKKKLENLDELFTGIRRSTLEKLPHNVVQDAYLKIATRNGVRKLKALKRLRIIFDMNESMVKSSLNPYYGGTKVKLTSEYVKESMEFPFFLKKGTFTALSSLYAFSSPDFKTCIYYDNRVHCAAEIEKLMQELKPNVIAAPSHMCQLNSELKEALVRLATDPEGSALAARFFSGAPANVSSDSETNDSVDSDCY